MELSSGTSASYYTAKVRYVADAHMRDESNSMSLALDHGNYVQLLDFASLRARLARSYAIHSSCVEKVIHTLVSLGPDTSETEFGKLARGAVADLTPTLRLLHEERDPVAEALVAQPWRFNVDLAQRPPWLPLTVGGPRTAVMEHWDVVAGSSAGAVAVGGVHADAWCDAELEEGGPWRGDADTAQARACADSRALGWGSMRRARFPLEAPGLCCATARLGLSTSLARRTALAYAVGSSFDRSSKKAPQQEGDAEAAVPAPPIPPLPATPGPGDHAPAAIYDALDVCLARMASGEGTEGAADSISVFMAWLAVATTLVSTRLALHGVDGTPVVFAPDVAVFARRIVAETIPLYYRLNAVAGTKVEIASRGCREFLKAVADAADAVRAAVADPSILAKALRSAEPAATAAVDASCFDSVCATIAREHAALAALLKRDALRL